MAIYHCSVKIIGRSSGRSAVGAAAYRAGEKITNERDGITHDYERKQGVVYSEILAPEHAPEWALDRSKLWNAVEQIEKSKDAQLAREFEIAIPSELNFEEQKDFVRDFVKEELVKHGMVADWSLHDKGDGNPHAHIMTIMRPFELDGNWGTKCKKEYIRDKDGERIKLKSGQWKSRKINTTNWDKQETLDKWRENLAIIGNKHLVKAGHEPTLDHRSNEAQGTEKLPTIHLGVEAHAMEKRGIRTERGDLNRKILEQNKSIQEIDKQITDLQKIRQEQEKKPQEIKIKVADLRDVFKARLRKITSIEADISKQKHQNLLLQHDLRTPYLKQAAEEHFNKNHENDIKENEADIEKYNADVVIQDKKWFTSRTEAEALLIRKIKLDTRKAEIKKYIANNVSMAEDGKYKDRTGGMPNTTQAKINTKADEIGAKKDHAFIGKIKDLRTARSGLVTKSLALDKEKTRCQKMIRTLDKGNPEQQISLPATSAGGGSGSSSSSSNDKNKALIAELLGVNAISKDVALIARSGAEDFSCIDLSALSPAEAEQQILEINESQGIER